MVFAPELNQEDQNLVAFLAGAALRALDRPGGYKELQNAGFGKRHVYSLLEKFGHDTTKLKKQIDWKVSKEKRYDACLCGHDKIDHRYDAARDHYFNCMSCFACVEFLSPRMMRGGLNQ
jgi:hypothetical protein